MGGVERTEAGWARGCGREDDGDGSAVVAARALSLSLLVLLRCWWARPVRSCSCSCCGGLDRTGVSLCRLALLLGLGWGWVTEGARLGVAEETWFWAWAALGGLQHQQQ